MPTIILATTNPHKVTELRAIFHEANLANLELLGLNDVNVPLEEPAETGTTFEQNASLKALSYSQQIGRPCLADDSGLIIDALAGKPGVISSHYSTDGVETGLTRDQRDALNIQRVLRELEAVPFERRSARFTCVNALAIPSTPDDPRPRIVSITEGSFEGRIGLPAPHPNPIPRGTLGFGYDPIFLLPPNYTTTSSELPREEKNRLSHRAHAAKRMAEEIRRLFASGQLR
jgi:XTP/dITP diphosphohydrolase